MKIREFKLEDLNIMGV